jgi:hypothetical protein
MGHPATCCDRHFPFGLSLEPIHTPLVRQPSRASGPRFEARSLGVSIQERPGVTSPLRPMRLSLGGSTHAVRRNKPTIKAAKTASIKQPLAFFSAIY